MFQYITAELVVICAVVAVDDAVGAVPVERIAFSLRRGDFIVAGRALQSSPGKIAASFYGNRSGSILLVAEDGGPQPVGGIVSGVLHRDDVVVVIIPGILNLRHHGLFLVIDALGGLGLLPCVVQGRQHQARQNGDDRDDDEQFSQSKFFLYLIHASNPLHGSFDFLEPSLQRYEFRTDKIKERGTGSHTAVGKWLRFSEMIENLLDFSLDAELDLFRLKRGPERPDSGAVAAGPAGEIEVAVPAECRSCRAGRAEFRQRLVGAERRERLQVPLADSEVRFPLCWLPFGREEVVPEDTFNAMSQGDEIGTGQQFRLPGFRYAFDDVDRGADDDVAFQVAVELVECGIHAAVLVGSCFDDGNESIARFLIPVVKKAPGGFECHFELAGKFRRRLLIGLLFRDISCPVGFPADMKLRDVFVADLDPGDFALLVLSQIVEERQPCRQQQSAAMLHVVQQSGNVPRGKRFSECRNQNWVLRRIETVEFFKRDLFEPLEFRKKIFEVEVDFLLKSVGRIIDDRHGRLRRFNACPSENRRQDLLIEF